MIRIQVQISEEQARMVKEAASEYGVSNAEVIRRALDQHLAGQVRSSRRQRAVTAIGGFRSGHRDVSKRHDDHVTDAFAE